MIQGSPRLLGSGAVSGHCPMAAEGTQGRTLASMPDRRGGVPVLLHGVRSTRGRGLDQVSGRVDSPPEPVQSVGRERFSAPSREGKSTFTITFH